MANSRKSKKQERDSREAAWRKKLAVEYRTEAKEVGRLLGVSKIVLLEKYFHPAEKEWIDKKLNELRYANFELPGGIFQEPQAASIGHQQKYLQALIQTSPKVLGSLRKFIPFYQKLFGRALSDEDIIDVVKKVMQFGQLFWDQAKNPVEGFPWSRTSCLIPPYYHWQRYKVMPTRILISLRSLRYGCRAK